MTKEINDKLNEIFAKEGFWDGCGDNLDSILNQVTESAPEITKDDLALYMVAIGKELNKETNEELSEESLDEVAGGIGFVTVLVAAVVIGGCAYAGSKVGPAIGEAIYYLTNKKK